MNPKELLKDYQNLKDEYIIVGVSAGPDSMALLHILKNNLKNKIVCAHINHNVRKESDEEEKYLKEYCKNNNIIFECMKIEKYEKKNFENEAREKRYTFYEKLLTKYHSHYLFLAHHGIDLIETILMKIKRGSNLEGYAGIREVSTLDNYQIIRPLLSLTKEDLIKYNKDNNIKYYIDHTNTDTKYTRNRYRMNIIPILQKEDKDIHKKYLNYSRLLLEYFDFVEEEVIKKLNNIYTNGYIKIDVLKKEHPFMQKNIIFYILSQTYNNKANIIKEKNVLDIIKLINNNKPNLKVNLPHDYIAIKEYNKLYIKKEIINNNDYKIMLDNNININNIIIKKVDKIDSNGNEVCLLDSNKIKLPLYLRNKKEGDYIELFGLQGKKKIKDIFIEKKIPNSIRNTYPLLVDSNDNILWIPFLKKSKYNSKKDEFYDIILTSHQKEEKDEKK